MKLSEYLEEYGSKKTHLAEKAKITKQTLHNLINGVDVKIATAAKIERATKGLVTCMELYEEYIEKKKKKKK